MNAAITECKNRADLMAYLLGNGTHFIKLNGFNTDAVRALCVFVRYCSMERWISTQSTFSSTFIYTRESSIHMYSICVCSQLARRYRLLILYNTLLVKTTAAQTYIHTHIRLVENEMDARDKGCRNKFVYLYNLYE